MRKIFTLALGLLLMACSDESALRFEISNGVLSYLPARDDTILYLYQNDSIYLVPEIYNTQNQRSEAPEDLGSLGTADYIELQTVTVTYSLGDSVTLRYDFRNTYTPGNNYPVSESFEVKLERQNTLAELSFERQDSLRCLLDCRFADTLVVDSTGYLNVYYADSGQANNIYINRNEGLAAFTLNQQTYKRAD